MLANFTLKIGHSETPTPQTNILIFLANKMLFAGTIHRFLSTRKQSMDKK